MRVAGKYYGAVAVRYSEVLGSVPTLSDITELLQQVDLRAAAFILSRMNLHLRAAMNEPACPHIGQVQGLLISQHLDDDIFQALKIYLGAIPLEERFVFQPLQILDTLHLALRVCSDTGLPDVTELDRHRIGKACFMMTDLLVTEGEAMRLLEGSLNDRTETLMMQLSSGFELTNAEDIGRVLARSHLSFRVLLNRSEVAQDIAMRCRSFNLAKEFEDTTGVSLDRWLTIVFGMYGIYSLYAGPTGLDQKVEDLVVDRKAFRGESSISQGDFESTLATLSTKVLDFSHVLKLPRPVDIRYDLTPFRSTPLIELKADKFVCSDIALLAEKMYTGVQWIIHDRLSSDRRNDLFTAWGVLFEHYLNYLACDRSFAEPLLFFPWPKWSDDHTESFDGAFLQDSRFVPMEYKAGFLDMKSRQSGNIDAFKCQVELKISPGCEQLARKIGALFHQEPKKRRSLKNLPSGHITKVIPVLVVQDQILRTPFVNWLLNKRFQELMLSQAITSKIEVLPLNVVTVHEYETLVDSAEARSFDLVGALQYRAVRDVEMRSELRNYLVSVPGYGEGPSRRLEQLHEEIWTVMLQYMFPSEGERLQSMNS
jgi:hypothetical protein